MTAAWFLGARGAVPQHEDEARATLEPVRVSTATVEEKQEPEWNEFLSDDSPELVGLSPREKGPNTTPSEKSVPHWLGLADDLHNPIIDQQISSSGTAAQREAAGQFGHGTMQYENSLEPVIRDGAALGQTYFAGNPHTIQEDSGIYMQPAIGDPWSRAVDSAEAQAGSRAAYQSTLYSEFMRATT